jgi:hypothetical protein
MDGRLHEAELTCSRKFAKLASRDDCGTGFSVSAILVSVNVGTQPRDLRQNKNLNHYLTLLLVTGSPRITAGKS